MIIEKRSAPDRFRALNPTFTTTGAVLDSVIRGLRQPVEIERPRKLTEKAK